MATSICAKNGSQPSFYAIPKGWTVHFIDRKLSTKQMDEIQQMIDDAQLMAMDTETMPIFFNPDFQEWQKRRLASDEPKSKVCPLVHPNKAALLQVAIQGADHAAKHVLLFDLQELFDRSRRKFKECEAGAMAHDLLQAILNDRKAYKLSQGLQDDLAQLKSSYDDECFQTSKIDRVIELSSVYRHAFPDEKHQKIYSLKIMTAMTLNCELNKAKQCSDWSRRPLPPALINYAVIDVIVMIDIYERLIHRIQDAYVMSTEFRNLSLQEYEPSNTGSTTADPINPPMQSMITSDQTWTKLQQSLEMSIDFTLIFTYDCVCGARFISRKTYNKHVRQCL